VLHETILKYKMLIKFQLLSANLEYDYSETSSC